MLSCGMLWRFVCTVNVCFGLQIRIEEYSLTWGFFKVHWRYVFGFSNHRAVEICCHHAFTIFASISKTNGLWATHSNHILSFEVNNISVHTFYNRAHSSTCNHLWLNCANCARNILPPYRLSIQLKHSFNPHLDMFTANLLTYTTVVCDSICVHSCFFFSLLSFRCKFIFSLQILIGFSSSFTQRSTNHNNSVRWDSILCKPNESIFTRIELFLGISILSIVGPSIGIIWD